MGCNREFEIIPDSIVKAQLPLWCLVAIIEGLLILRFTRLPIV